MERKPPIVVPVRIPPLLAPYAKDAKVWWGFLVAAMPLLPPACLGGTRLRVNVSFKAADYEAFESLRAELDLSQSRMVEAGCAVLFARDRSSSIELHPNIIPELAAE